MSTVPTWAFLWHHGNSILGYKRKFTVHAFRHWPSVERSDFRIQPVSEVNECLHKFEAFLFYHQHFYLFYMKLSTKDKSVCVIHVREAMSPDSVA